MSRVKSNSKTPHDITLATFRLRQGLWDQFKSLCEHNRTNATEALIAYIEQAVESGSLGGAIAAPQTTTNYLDIDDRIKYQTSDGVIREAIYDVKEDIKDMIDALTDRIYELEKQLQPTPTPPPQPEPTPPQPTPPEPEPQPQEVRPETETKSEPEVNYQSQLQPLHPEVVPQPPQPPEPTQQEPTPLQPETTPETKPEPTPESELTLPHQHSEIDKHCLSPLLKKKPGLRNLLIKIGFSEIINSSRQPGGFLLSLQYAKESNLFSNLVANYSSLQKYLNVELKENSLVPIAKILRDCGYVVTRDGKNYVIKHYLA